MRQGLLDDLGAPADLAAGPGMAGIAHAEDVERREGPVAVRLGVQDAFDGDVLVRQPGDRGSERAAWRRGGLVGHGWRKEPQLGLGSLSGPLGALDGHVDPERQGCLLQFLRLGFVDAAAEPSRRAAGEAYPRSEGGPALPGRPDEVAEGAVGGHDDPHEDDRDERDRSTDVAEGAGRDLRDRRADDAARALAGRRLAPLVVLRDRQERDEHERPTRDRDDRAAPHETEPEFGRKSSEQERHDKRAPPQAGHEEGVPPLQHRSLIGDERDDRQQREREQCDRADLVADARIDGGDGTALRLAARHPARAHTCMITGSTIGRRFVRSYR